MNTGSPPVSETSTALQRKPHQISPELNELRRGHASFAFFLHELGWSQSRIARELACSKSTVVAMLRFAAEENA